MKYRYLFFVLGLMVISSSASVLDEIAALEAQKGQGRPASTAVSSKSETDTPLPKVKPAKPYTLPNGTVINLNDYTLVLFMQAHCPYCQQFDPQLAELSKQTGFSVFAYTLDGQGDAAFPNAAPAPQSVVQTFFGNGMPVMTPTVFLVEVNTLRTYPLLQGMTSMPDVLNRINSNLIAITAGGK